MNKIEQKIIGYKVVLDPCAGGDSKHKMAYPEALKSFSKSIATIDIRNDSLAELQEDYLVQDLSYKPDSIEYMHCIWKKGHKPDFTQRKVI